jgi:hypothetical protein
MPFVLLGSAWEKLAARIVGTIRTVDLGDPERRESFALPSLLIETPAPGTRAGHRGIVLSDPAISEIGLGAVIIFPLHFRLGHRQELDDEGVASAEIADGSLENGVRLHLAARSRSWLLVFAAAARRVRLPPRSMIGH